jgi:hypothetical protein
MPIEQKSLNIVPLTRGLAISHYSMPALMGERELKASRVAKFVALIKSKKFPCLTWTIAVVRETGQKYRADGQHSSCALSRVPDDKFPLGRTIGYQEIWIDSVEEDAANVFDQFDNGESARRPVDYIGVYLARHPDIQGLRRPFAVNVARGIDRYLRDQNRLEKDVLKHAKVWEPQQLGAYFENPMYCEFALWLYRWWKTKNGWLTKKPVMVAATLSSWLERPNDATVFWNYVFMDNHPLADHETRELSRQLNRLRGQYHSTKEQFRSITKRHWTKFRRSIIADAKNAKKQAQQPPPPKAQRPSTPPENRPSL